ncbi:hypothetical protein NW768_008019 [Fusarium equiseti]|uniref:Uncharacterized protein n=1 Tax=Fusarium equiseti TaxID=61235 RepID=A0ABQ8R5Z4_FUSEQ|nr:hypothetical protein NW768_008019 [Fusarium equiseti]
MHWKEQAKYAAIVIGGLIFIGIVVASGHHKTPNPDLDIEIDEHFRNHHRRLPKVPKSQQKRKEGEGWWINGDEYPGRCEFTKEDAECRDIYCPKHRKKENV